MATVTGLTADRMLAIEAESIVDGFVDAATGHLHLTKHDGTDIDAGPVIANGLFVDIVSDQAAIDGAKTFVKQVKSLQNITAQNGVAGAQVKIGNVGAGGVAGLEFGSATEYMGLIAGARVGLFLASTKTVDFQASGISASGANHYFGAGALGALNQCQLHVLSASLQDMVLVAEATGAGNAWLHLRPSGTGVVTVQNATGNDKFQFDQNGTFRSGLTAPGTSAGGVVVGGGVNGYHGEVNFVQDLGNGTIHAVTSNASGNSTFAFDMRGTSTGAFKWRTGAAGAVADRMTLDSTAKLTVLGGGTGSIEISSGSFRTTGVGGVPRLYMKATDGPVDQKVWDILPNGGTLSFRSINDAENASQSPLVLYPTSAATETQLGLVASGLGARRVKFGNAGTGPGGVGRALYIDN